MKKPKQKAKPVRVWVCVNKETNEIVRICEHGVSRRIANNILSTGERLARVEIKEV